jgi:hypothetical protein
LYNAVCRVVFALVSCNSIRSRNELDGFVHEMGVHLMDPATVAGIPIPSTVRQRISTIPNSQAVSLTSKPHLQPPNPISNSQQHTPAPLAPVYRYHPPGELWRAANVTRALVNVSYALTVSPLIIQNVVQSATWTCIRRRFWPSMSSAHFEAANDGYVVESPQETKPDYVVAFHDGNKRMGSVLGRS